MRDEDFTFDIECEYRRLMAKTHKVNKTISENLSSIRGRSWPKMQWSCNVDIKNLPRLIRVIDEPYQREEW
jgi:hypothetical protein